MRPQLAELRHCVYPADRWDVLALLAGIVLMAQWWAAFIIAGIVLVYLSTRPLTEPPRGGPLGPPLGGGLRR